jgi:long-subunit acyl-CoA synthetase (AMP-forming)
MVTGMAPIRRNVLDAYNQLGQNLLEAYGITEVGLVAWNSAHDNRIGTVGKPVRDHQIAFGDESEILVKSAHPLTKGYFTAEDAVSAAQTFREDGFVATGDIGRFDGDHLVLSGRKKDIIITTGGAKFHPSDLERRLNTVDETRQVVVFNDPDSGAIVAVICVDDPDDKHTIELIERTVESINREVPTYMRISRKVLTRTRFTAENGFLTRNLKPNRPAIARSFAADAAAIR